ncbi:hypothetical protein CHUAL_008084 [Chamberlinius hualienensis]
MLAEVALAAPKRGGQSKQKQRYATREKIIPQIIKKPALPIGNVPETTKDVMRRVSQGESLNFSQIRILSDKLLLNVFAEFTSDEIRRSYTYSCYLMPDRCKQKYNSFGNETSARLLMKGHLLGHINELISEENDPKSLMKSFAAEPVPTKSNRNRVRTSSVTESPRKTSESEFRLTVKPSIMRKSRLLGNDHRQEKENQTVSNEECKIVKDEIEEFKSPIVIKQEPIEEPDEEEEEEEQQLHETQEDETEEAAVVRELEEVEEEPVVVSHEVQEDDDGNTLIYVVQEEVIIDDDGQLVTRTEPTSIENFDESMLLEDTGSSQPYHDHSYSYTNIADESTQISESPGTETVDNDEKESNDMEMRSEIGMEEVVIELGHDMDSSELERIVTMAAQAASTPKEYIQTVCSAMESSSRQSDVYRQFHIFPTAQSKSRKQASHTILASEEELYAAAVDDDPEEDADLIPGSQDWEKRMAMKYIRLLRTKKKDERIPLVCRICKDKTFTAQATLMYHYRSHAGIKPFQCTICSTSFTRQHSLNYHMLIHSNKSRFTCSHCGRKFRHPSHFKEHMRRHTGETPFVCEDCEMRFKTRNTYKRHLKTRHGKLLTAAGIHTLTEEEFNKVRTNPKRRVSTMPLFNRLRDMETQWPEPEHIGVEEADVAASNLTSQIVEAFSQHNQIAIDMEEAEEYTEEEPTTIEVFGDPALGQTLKVLTAEGQLIDVKVIKRKQEEYAVIEGEIDPSTESEHILMDEQDSGETVQEATLVDANGETISVLTSDDIQGVDLQPILDSINVSQIW